MKNKRWTPKTEITEAILKFREKRKWQIALRRYVLIKQNCSFYAPFFGIDIEGFRQWVELQFTEDINWDNFGKAWQFDHIVPVTYFNFEEESDLRLCWNFLNIRVERIELNKNRGNRVDVIASKAYFDKIFTDTAYPMAELMVKKIESIEVSQILSTQSLEEFIKKNDETLKHYLSFSSYDFDQVNSGNTMSEILAEKAMLKKFGK